MVALVGWKCFWIRLDILVLSRRYSVDDFVVSLCCDDLVDDFVDDFVDDDDDDDDFDCDG